MGNSASRIFIEITIVDNVVLAQQLVKYCELTNKKAAHTFSKDRLCFIFCCL